MILHTHVRDLPALRWLEKVLKFVACMAGEKTIPSQETTPTATSKMVAGGFEARVSLQLTGGGVFSELCACCCRCDRSCPLHQETGQGCSMLVTPRETGGLGTQQGRQTATLVLTASNSILNIKSWNGACEEVDPRAPSSVVTGITSTQNGSNSMTSQYGRVCEEVDPCVPSGSSLEHTHVKVVQEVNSQATSMLVTGHKNRLVRNPRRGEDIQCHAWS